MERLPGATHVGRNVIDGINLQLLRELQKDARQHSYVLARTVGISPTSVTRRLQRLESEKVILGYSCIVNHSRLGRQVLGLADDAAKT